MEENTLCLHWLGCLGSMISKWVRGAPATRGTKEDDNNNGWSFWQPPSLKDFDNKILKTEYHMVRRCTGHKMGPILM